MNALRCVPGLFVKGAGLIFYRPLRYVITLEPFLYICVIASTRRILTTGAQIAYMEEVTDQIFNRYLLDLGANVLVIVALVMAVYLARRAAAPTAA